VGFVVDKVALEQVSSEYICPAQFSFHRMFFVHLSSEVSTEALAVTDVPGGLSLTQLHELNKIKIGIDENLTKTVGLKLSLNRDI
jgi:hypothetical protein